MSQDGAHMSEHTIRATAALRRCTLAIGASLCLLLSAPAHANPTPAGPLPLEPDVTHMTDEPEVEQATPTQPHMATSTPAASTESLPLGAPARQPVRPQQQQAAAGTGILDHWFVRTVASLIVVIALIFVMRWMIVRMAGRSGTLATQLGAGGRAPSGVLEVLGRYPIARGQSFVLLKIDRRILLIAQTAAGFQTLTEIADADDVASILLKTRDEEGESMTKRFTSMLRDLERDPSVMQEPIPEPNQPAPPPGLAERLAEIRGLRA